MEPTAPSPGASVTAEPASPLEATGLAALLAEAAERGATDVHLTPGQPPFVRVNGSLVVLDMRIPDLRSLVAFDPAG